MKTDNHNIKDLFLKKAKTLLSELIFIVKPQTNSKSDKDIVKPLISNKSHSIRCYQSFKKAFSSLTFDTHLIILKIIFKALKGLKDINAIKIKIFDINAQVLTN